MARDAQMSMFDVEVDNAPLVAALDRHEYLQTAVDEQTALSEAIADMLRDEFPDAIPGKRRINVSNQHIIEYEIKEAVEKRIWKTTATPFTAATQDGNAVDPKRSAP